MQEMQVQSLGREGPLEKEMQPTPVLLPGKLHRQKSLAGYLPGGGKESDMTWQPTPVFLPGTSRGQRSLVGFRLWGRTESDTTEHNARACARAHTHTHRKGGPRGHYAK